LLALEPQVLLLRVRWLWVLLPGLPLLLTPCLMVRQPSSRLREAKQKLLLLLLSHSSALHTLTSCICQLLLLV
jgi:hypothetical protein